MIAMRSSAPTKVTKPPPPVPPRPSKNIVAEALAKSRKLENSNNTNGVPPVVKSQSYSAIYKFNNNSSVQVPKIDRTSLDEQPLKPKPATRTLIYQSSNIKLKQQPALAQRVASVEEIRINHHRESNNKINNQDGKPIIKANSFKLGESHNKICAPREVILVRSPSPKIQDSRDSSLESLGDSEPISRSNSFKTMETNNSSDSVISEDETNWQAETTDRNHVNTLIDEMFASVLEQPHEISDSEKEIVSKPCPEIVKSNPDIITIQNPPKSFEIKQVQVTNKFESVSQDKFNNVPKEIISNNKVQITNDSKNVIENESCLDSAKTIVVIESQPCTMKTDIKSPSPSSRKIDDKFNHELLISELSSMKRERQISKRQRRPSESSSVSSPSAESKIQHSDWVEVNNGKEIRLSSCQITIEDQDEHMMNNSKQLRDVLSRLEMANLHGLPPLPKSLSGFNIEGGPLQPPSSIGRNRSKPQSTNASTNGDLGSLKKPTNLDAKLALLRREMYSLRQLDLSLLSQLWSLNESIQDFRHMLQEQDERSVLSPPSPSPTTSSGEEVDGDDFFQPSSMRFRLAPPPPPPHRRTSNSSSGTGSSV